MIDAIAQRLALAEHLYQTDAYDRADDVLDQVAADAMEIERFWVLRAAVAFDRGDPEAAIRAARAGLARFPQSVGLLVILGGASRKQGALPEAEEALLAALAVDPEDVTALCAYAVLCATVGQDDKARRLLDRAGGLAPEDDEVLLAAYRVANLRGDDAETGRIAEELARRGDGHAGSIALLGVEAAKRGEVRRTEALLGRAARADIRVVDALGAGAYREARVWAHPLLWPMWPIHRFGVGPIYVLAVGAIVLLRLSGHADLAGPLALLWIAYAVYTWVAPPLVRRLVGGGR